MVAWSPEEDRIILEMFETCGRKWGKIASVLSARAAAVSPDGTGGSVRTSASVRNRFLRIEKGRALRAEGKSKNRCAACGQQKLGHVCTARLNAARKPAANNTPIAPAADILLGGWVPDTAVVPAGEAAEMLPVPPYQPADALALADTATERWPIPKKMVAWQKHEQEAAAAARMAMSQLSFVAPHEPADAAGAEEAAAVAVMEEEVAVPLEQPKGAPTPLRLEGGDVLLLTKQPSGEVMVSVAPGLLRKASFLYESSVLRSESPAVVAPMLAC